MGATVFFGRKAASVFELAPAPREMCSPGWVTLRNGDVEVAIASMQTDFDRSPFVSRRFPLCRLPAEWLWDGRSREC